MLSMFVFFGADVEHVCHTSAGGVCMFCFFGGVCSSRADVRVGGWVIDHFPLHKKLIFWVAFATRSLSSWNSPQWTGVQQIVQGGVIVGQRPLTPEQAQAVASLNQAQAAGAGGPPAALAGAGTPAAAMAKAGALTGEITVRKVDPAETMNSMGAGGEESKGGGKDGTEGKDKGEGEKKRGKAKGKAAGGCCR